MATLDRPDNVAIRERKVLWDRRVVPAQMDRLALLAIADSAGTEARRRKGTAPVAPMDRQAGRGQGAARGREGERATRATVAISGQMGATARAGVWGAGVQQGRVAMACVRRAGSRRR